MSTDAASEQAHTQSAADRRRLEYGLAALRIFIGLIDRLHPRACAGQPRLVPRRPGGPQPAERAMAVVRHAAHASG